MSGDWFRWAECRWADPEELFVTGHAQHEAAKICRHCPVQLECLAEALDDRISYGVWGGMTESQRRKLLRQHPGVPSWRAVLLGQLSGSTQFEAVAR